MRYMAVITGAGRVLREALFPERCVACGRFRAGLFCERCRSQLTPATGEGRCRNCAAPWPGGDNCPACFGWDQLDGGRAAFSMEGAARDVVHALKYDRVKAVAPAMAEAMRTLLTGVEGARAFAIPLHRSRLHSRGFNQSQLLLDLLRWERAPGTLKRIRKTDTQVGLALHERRANVAGAFRYDGPSLDGQRIVLVDDVITTGATANECARVLREAGVREVLVIAFARATPPARVSVEDAEPILADG